MFKIKDLKKMNKILDIKITRDRKNQTFRMNQIYYLVDVLDWLHMNIDKHKSTEFFINGYDALRPTKSDDKQINQKNYQHAIDSIIYAAIYTRFTRDLTSSSQ